MNPLISIQAPFVGPYGTKLELVVLSRVAVVFGKSLASYAYKLIILSTAQ